MINDVPEPVARNVHLFRYYGRNIIGRPAHVVRLNDTDTRGFRVWPPMKQMLPNMNFALTEQHSSSTISKKDMSRDILIAGLRQLLVGASYKHLIASLVHLKQTGEAEFFRVSVAEMGSFETNKGALC
jgi:hypothetical protein